MKKTNPRKFLSTPPLSNLLTSIDNKTHCKDLGTFEEDFFDIRKLYFSNPSRETATCKSFYFKILATFSKISTPLERRTKSNSISLFFPNSLAKSTKFKIFFNSKILSPPANLKRIFLKPFF